MIHPHPEHQTLSVAEFLAESKNILSIYTTRGVDTTTRCDNAYRLVMCCGRSVWHRRCDTLRKGAVMPGNLPRLVPHPDATQTVEVQDTQFLLDVLGR